MPRFPDKKTAHKRQTLQHQLSALALCLSLSLSLSLSLACANAQAEQMQEFGVWQVHYVVIPTTFLLPEIAQQYNITRGKDRALINVSLIHNDNGPSTATATGEVVNLLSQSQALEFREVREGDAIYYLADLKHTDRDILRFELQVKPPQGRLLKLKFQQKMYADR